MDNEPVTVAFSEMIASQIRSAVDAGEYRSQSDVIQDALRLWSENRAMSTEHDSGSLRQAWDAGKSGDLSGALDFSALRQEARGRLKARTIGPDLASDDPQHAG